MANNNIWLYTATNNCHCASIIGHVDNDRTMYGVALWPNTSTLYEQKKLPLKQGVKFCENTNFNFLTE